MEHRVKEHVRLRNDLNLKLIGELSVAERDIAPAVAEVQTRTGVRPPTWFNSGGVSFADVTAIAVTQRAGR